MVSHYGNERVCPINIFKVIGLSMMEIYEESQSGDIGTTSQSSVIPPPASEGLSEGTCLIKCLHFIKIMKVLLCLCPLAGSVVFIARDGIRLIAHKGGYFIVHLVTS